MKFRVGPGSESEPVPETTNKVNGNSEVVGEDTFAVLMAALGDDEVIRRAIRFTAVRALEHANLMMDQGSVANRVTVIRSMMPALVRTLDRKETDDELSKLKEELTALMAEVREGVKGLAPIPDDVSEIPQDMPR